MSSRILLILGFSIATLHATDPTPVDLLRQGLFEEEANQNLDKAAEHYRAVIASHERERALAAAATFRLGEIARKKNDEETAAAAFRTVTERFPEQAELARLSRENLAALGVETIAPTAPDPASADPEDAEIARLKELARNSPDLIDGADVDGFRPIHHAAVKGWTRVISYVLENKADPNGLTIKERFTSLQLASVHGHLGAVKALLAAEADPNVTLWFGRNTVNSLPAMDGSLKGATGEWSALDLAIVYDRRETALALMRAGSDIQRAGPRVLDQIGFNTLMLAIYLKRNYLAQALIDAGSPLSAIGKEEPITPLGVALRENNSIVAPLLKAGADPNLAEYSKRHSPLHYVRSIEIAKLLVEAGADVKATATNGETPLHLSFSAEMAEWLISKGADPNAKDSSGLTPLDYMVSSNYVDHDVAIIETLLKHGATVADPRALLRRASSAKLPFVGERLVYPKLHNPDAILLSVSGDHSFNQAPATSPGEPSRKSGGSKSPEVIAVDNRLSAASPPPSLAEVMCMAFGERDYPRRIRIIRRGDNGRFDIIRAWTANGDNSLPTDWPALVWGDTVEVLNSYAGNSSPRIYDFAAMIPARAVTYRLGGLEFPQTFSGNKIWLGYEMLWLDSEPCRALRSPLPDSIILMTDLNRCVIHRKGLAESITLDFSKSTDAKFRLLDGDTVEMLWNVPKLYQEFKEGCSNVLGPIATFPKLVTPTPHSLVELLSDCSFTNAVDFSKVCILRRAENWKPEMVDLKGWLEQLPPPEKWERDALISSAPKLNSGDLVILIQNYGEDADKTAAEIHKKTKEVSYLMMSRRISRPGFLPLPSR